jgi:hypothetical protein
MSNSNGFRDVAFLLATFPRLHRLPRPRPPGPRRTRLVRGWRPWFLIAGALFPVLVGCTPSIGDKCQISTDCSIRGDRLCDLSQPNGYCTQLNCGGNSCPDEAACVLFDSAIPGCGFDDRAGPYGSRVARSFCVAKCDDNSDCRSGYVCADARTPPWSAVILDDDQGKRGCLIRPLPGSVSTVNASTVPAPVCAATAPPVDAIDASAPSIQAPSGRPPVSDAGQPSDAGGGG